MRPSSGSSSSDSLSVFAARVSASWRVMCASWASAVRRRPSAAAAALTNTSPSWLVAAEARARGARPRAPGRRRRRRSAGRRRAAASGASAAGERGGLLARRAGARARAAGDEVLQRGQAGDVVQASAVGSPAPVARDDPDDGGRPRTARAAARTARRRSRAASGDHGLAHVRGIARTRPRARAGGTPRARRRRGCSPWDPRESLLLFSTLGRQAFTLVGAAGPGSARPRRGGRVAEGTRLLSEYGAESSIAGSNPALSAGRPCRDAVARLSVPLRP